MEWLIAATSSDGFIQIVQPLLSGFGIAGPVLAYFIWKDKKREEHVERLDRQFLDLISAVDRNTISINTLIIASEWSPAAAKEIAAKVSREAEQAIERRGGNRK